MIDIQLIKPDQLHYPKLDRTRLIAFILVLWTAILFSSPHLSAQDIALKNNLLYDIAATPNLSLEVILAEQWSIGFGAGFNPFPLKDTREHK